MGDLTGDGNEDLIDYNQWHLARAATRQSRCTSETDTAAFTAGTPIEIGLADNIAVGDFTGDGKLDLAVTYDFEYKPDYVEIYPGNGGGTFGASPGRHCRRQSLHARQHPGAPFLDAGSFVVTDHGPVANNDQATTLPASPSASRSWPTTRTPTTPR